MRLELFESILTNLPPTTLVKIRGASYYTRHEVWRMFETPRRENHAFESQLISLLHVRYPEANSMDYTQKLFASPDVYHYAVQTNEVMNTLMYRTWDGTCHSTRILCKCSGFPAYAEIAMLILQHNRFRPPSRREFETVILAKRLTR